MSQQEPKRFARGDVIAKKYEIERFLGEGLIATTYLARHIGSQKDLVIKFIKPNLMTTSKDQDRLKILFERARGVRHDLLIRHGELGTHDDLFFYTEEYFASESLRQVINSYVSEAQRFTLQEACQIVISILEAAEVGHHESVIHQNIKPENILVNTRRTGPAGNSKIIRTIRVSGLGMSGLISPTIFAESFVNRKEAPYLAPELSGFHQEGAVQADIYSVGVILYELLCGQRPMGTYLAPTQIRDDLPEHMDDIVEIALAHSPEDRYPTCRDMINDIQRSFSLELKQDSRVVSTRNTIITIGVGLALVSAVGGYMLHTQSGDPIEDARQADEILRREILIKNPLPSKETVQQISAAHPEMVYVPGGTFLRGRISSERPEVYVSTEALALPVPVDPFFIDRFEYPNRKDAQPTTQVSWREAELACEEQGKRLCTDNEWSKACKGPGNFIYSYADTFDPALCGADLSDPYRSGSRTDCLSTYGAYDMSGGVREWTSSVMRGADSRKLVMGGMRGNAQRGSRCAFSVDEAEVYADYYLGFRCCMSAEDAATTPTAPGTAPTADPGSAPTDPATVPAPVTEPPAAP